MARGSLLVPLFTVSVLTPNVGQVKIFGFDSLSGAWTQLGQSLYGVNRNDQFGISISFNSDGSRLAVGANQEFILTPPTFGWSGLYPSI